METPPRISQAPAVAATGEAAKPIELTPVPPAADSVPRFEGSPVHALSALLLIAVDNLWNLTEWIAVDWFITIPLSFITVFVPVFLIQKALKRDSNGRALAFAALLAALAAIPTSITGTPVGLALLAWTGLGRLLGKGHTERN